MTKYVYIVRRLGPDSEVEYEEALTELGNAKKYMRKQIAEYEIWIHNQFGEPSQPVKDCIYKKYEDMPIELRKTDWAWEYSISGPYAAMWELKRLEIKENI